MAGWAKVLFARKKLLKTKTGALPGICILKKTGKWRKMALLTETITDFITASTSKFRIVSSKL